MTPMRIRLSCYCISHVCIIKWWFLQIFSMAISGTETSALLRAILKLTLLFFMFLRGWTEALVAFKARHFAVSPEKYAQWKVKKNWGERLKIPVLFYVINSARWSTMSLVWLNIAKKSLEVSAFSDFCSIKGCQTGSVWMQKPSCLFEVL